MLGNGWSACAQLCSRLGPRQDAAWYTGRVERPLVFITRRLVLAPQSVLGAGIQIDLRDSEDAVHRGELLRRVREASALPAGPGGPAGEAGAPGPPPPRLLCPTPRGSGKTGGSGS